jgi:hypothetical protein
MAKKTKKFTGVLQVSISPETIALTEFECDQINTDPTAPVTMNPSLYGRIALMEKLSRDGVLQRYLQKNGKGNANQK